MGEKLVFDRAAGTSEVLGDSAAECVTWPDSLIAAWCSKGECFLFRSMLCSLVMLGAVGGGFVFADKEKADSKDKIGKQGAIRPSLPVRRP